MQRTLVKSPPELWAELSDPDSLARHLGDLGEIRIARVQAERSVEWEADSASGTIALEPSGWGTRVTLTIARESSVPEVPVAEPEPVPEVPEPESESEPRPEPRAGRDSILARIFRRWRKEQPAVEPEPAHAEEQPPDLAAELAVELARLEEAMAEQDAELLGTVLDRLGAAHHRPFSRG